MVTIAQVLVIAVGAVAVALGMWLLTRGSATSADKPSEAKTPVVSFSGPPGLLVVLAGLALVVYPFTPWWPGEPRAEPAPKSDGEGGGASPRSEVLRLEAEDGTVTPPMQVGSGDDASGGAYVASDVEGAGEVRFDLDVVGGEYYVWGLVSSPTGRGNSNSLTVRLDDLPGDVWDFYEDDTLSPDLPMSWQWERVSLRCGGDFNAHNCDPWAPELAAGQHTFVLAGREPSSRVDALVVTNDPDFAP
jgi:hypothetical protein